MKLTPHPMLQVEQWIVHLWTHSGEPNLTEKYQAKPKRTEAKREHVFRIQTRFHICLSTWFSKWIFMKRHNVIRSDIEQNAEIHIFSNCLSLHFFPSEDFDFFLFAFFVRILTKNFCVCFSVFLLFFIHVLQILREKNTLIEVVIICFLSIGLNLLELHAIQVQCIIQSMRVNALAN